MLSCARFASVLVFVLLSLGPMCGQALPQDQAKPAAPTDAHMGSDKPATPSTTLLVTIFGQPAVHLSLADLQVLPQTKVAALNAHSKQTENYSGPLVAAVLAKAGLTLSEHAQHQVLDSYVVATGTDGYFVVFSGAELQPQLHRAEPIIAIAEDAQPLTRTGAFQLVDPLDVKPARWVRNLTSLSMQAVPSPTK